MGGLFATYYYVIGLSKINYLSFFDETEPYYLASFTNCKNRNSLQLTINGRPISSKSSAKYLGLILDQTLSFSEHA